MTDFDTNQFKKELMDGLNIHRKIILGPIIVRPITYAELQERICQAGHLFRENRNLTQSKKENEGVVHNLTFSNCGPWNIPNGLPDIKPHTPDLNQRVQDNSGPSNREPPNRQTKGIAVMGSDKESGENLSKQENQERMGQETQRFG